MSWFRTEGVGGRSGPDQDLHLFARRKIRVPNIVRKTGSFVAGATGAASFVQGVASTIPESVSQVASGIFTTIKTTAAPYVTAAANMMPEAIVNNMPTVAGTTAAAASALGAVHDVYDYGKSTISWGIWAIKVLPVGVQIGLGIGAVGFAIWMWRGGAQNNVTVNVNMPPQAKNDECTVTTTKNGSTITTTQVCPQSKSPIPAATPETISPKNSSENSSEFARFRFVKAINAVADIGKMHKRLKSIQEHQNKLLFQPTLLKLNKIVSTLDSAIANNFKSQNLQTDLDEAKIVLKTAEEEINDYTREITKKMYSLAHQKPTGS